MMIFGAAWQNGLIPLSYEAILKAITLNGAAVERNAKAFEFGRWAVLNPDSALRVLTPNVVDLPKTLDEKIAFRAEHLTDYQGKRLANRYRKLVDRFTEPKLREAVAIGYHKLLSYKDEYEVARLLLQSEDQARAAFDGDIKLTYHLAPPLLSKTGPDGRPSKREFKSVWMFKLLAKLKRLRGTPFDPFGRTSERKMERALIKQFEADMAGLVDIRPDQMDAAVALAELPLQIRGFGPVKQANEAKASKRREELLAALGSSEGDKIAAE